MRYTKFEGVGSFRSFSGEQPFGFCISFANVQSNSLHIRSCRTRTIYPRIRIRTRTFFFFAIWTHVLHCTFVMGYGGDMVRRNA